MSKPDNKSKAAPKTTAGVASAVAVAAAVGAASVAPGAAKTDAASHADKAGAAKTPCLVIVSRPDRFRRAGFEFTSEARSIPLSELSEAQISELRAEKKLVVTDGFLEG